jgi:hypothetical protein
MQVIGVSRGRGCHEVFRGAYMAGERVPLLRRPIVSGCVRGTVRPNDLRICPELQARPGGRVRGCWNAQEGGETNGHPRLVDASCEVGEGLCWDILCLVRWVGVRHAVGPSSVGEHLATDTREGCPCTNRSYLVGGRRSVWYGEHQVLGDVVL